MSTHRAHREVVLIKFKNVKIYSHGWSRPITVALPFISSDAQITLNVHAGSGNDIVFQLNYANCTPSHVDADFYLINGDISLKVDMSNIATYYVSSSKINLSETGHLRHEDESYEMHIFITPTYEKKTYTTELLGQIAVIAKFKGAFARGLAADSKFLIGDKTIEVAKFVLMASSPVFEAMFANDWKDAKNGEIVIEDVKYEAMLEFLKALYAQRSEPKSVLDAFDVCVVADKYDVEFVKTQAMDYIMDNLKREEIGVAIQLFKVATQFSNELVKNMSIDHLAANLTNENVLQFLTMAEEYNSNLLREAAFAHLAANMTDAKVLHFLTMAEEYNSDCLREAAFAHLAKLRGKTRIRKLPGFTELSPSLLHRILEHLDF